MTQRGPRPGLPLPLRERLQISAIADLAPRSHPKLSLTTSDGFSSRPCLVLQHDPTAGQYQVRKLTPQAATSMVSLSDWQPIGSIPAELIDNPSPTWSEDDSEERNATTKPTRNNIARISAWIKRSGRGLVLRLRRQNNRSQPDFTDIHFAAKTSGSVNSDQSPIPELSGIPIHELPTLLYPGELHSISKAIPVELPGTHGSSELPVKNKFSSSVTTNRTPRSTTVYQHSSKNAERALDLPSAPDVFSRRFSFDAWPDSEDAFSPAPSVRTRLSMADTAVAEGNEDGDSSRSEVSQPVARGLTVRGSVRFRCAAHSNFEPESPVEILRLIDRTHSNTERPSRRGLPLDKVDRNARLPASDILEKSATDEIAANDYNWRDRHAVSPTLIKSSGEVDDRTTRTSALQRQTSYAVTSFHTRYEQDLWVARVHTETRSITTEILAMPDSSIQGLNQMSGLLSKVDQHNRADLLNEQDSIAAGMRKHPEEIRSSPTASTEVTPKRERPDSCDVPLDAWSGIRTLPSSPDMPVPASVGKSNGKISSSTADGTDFSPVQMLPPPVSPLSIRDKSQQHSLIDSNFSPTPITPKHLDEQDFDAGGSGGSSPDVSEPVPEAAATKPRSSSASIILDSVNASPMTSTVNDLGAANSGPAGANDVLTTKSGPHVREVKYISDYLDHQLSPAPDKPLPQFALSVTSDDKIPARYKNTRFQNLQLDTTFTDHGPHAVLEPSESADSSSQSDSLWTDHMEPERTRSAPGIIASIIACLAEVTLQSAVWLQRQTGQEPPVPAGHARVRWQCTCGEHLYDDFIELRPGAAKKLAAVLNRETPQPYHAPASGSRSSHSSFHNTPNSSNRASPATPLSSRSTGSSPYRNNTPYKGTPISSRAPSLSSGIPVFMQTPLYLLTCINEARDTPKLRQVPLHQYAVSTDSDLANVLRAEYTRVNQPWYRSFRLRGLTSIDFVQFYVHRNRFADIRKRGDVPPNTQMHDYEFTPTGTSPPFGPHYLMHLFKHPHEYDDETIAYHSIPKKLEMLAHGVGWGISLTEGFLPQRIWLFIGISFTLFGIVFAVVYTVKEHDIQGAFGVASFSTTLAGFVFGFAQACLG